MRLEEIKKELPETPDFIHRMILEEVENQLGEENNTAVHIKESQRRRRKWGPVRVAAVAALCVLGFSTVAYAGYQLYTMYVEKQGKYGISAGITMEKGTASLIVPHEIPQVKIQPGYIPEGMEGADDASGKTRLFYSETPNQGGISIGTVLLDSDDTDQILTKTGVIESEKRTFGTREGIYLRFQDLEQDKTFNQMICLLCPEEYQVVIMNIGDDVTKEDAVKFAENLSLVKTGEMEETENLYSWSEYVSPQIEESEPLETSISEKDLSVVKPGEWLEQRVTGETENGEYLELDKIQMRVDAVQISDNLSLLDGTELPDGWKEAVGSDGKLVANHLSYIKRGDGVETLDQVVKTETLNQKLLFVTVTYKNPTETPVYHMLYHGCLMLIDKKDGMYSVRDVEAENFQKDGVEYDFATGDGVASSTDMAYYSIHDDYGNGGNYIPVLKPGEELKADMAWIINEPDLSKAFLNLSGEGACWEFTDTVKEVGLVDIRQ